MTATEPATARPATTAEQTTDEQGRHHRRRRAASHRRGGKVGTALLVLLGLFVALVAVAVLSGNWQIRPVLSGSMRPGLPVGGVAVTEKVPLSDIKVRDVIVFHKPTNPAEMVMHRVIKLRHTGSTYTVKTQGDANAVADPWTLRLKGNTAYRVRYSLPVLGYPGVWMHNAGRTNLLTVGVGVLVLLGAVSLWRKDKGQGGPSRTDPAPPGEDAGDDGRPA